VRNLSNGARAIGQGRWFEIALVYVAEWIIQRIVSTMGFLYFISTSLT
jgi:hypothetical protein